MAMVECVVKISSTEDIQKFISIVNSIECDIDLVKGSVIVDAKSLMGIFIIDVSQPTKIVIHSDDESLLDKFNEWRV
jgi:phosphocarrier protein HPr